MEFLFTLPYYLFCVALVVVGVVLLWALAGWWVVGFAAAAMVAGVADSVMKESRR